MFLLAAVALLIVLGSVGFFSFNAANQNAANARATATAQAYATLTRGAVDAQATLASLNAASTAAAVTQIAQAEAAASATASAEQSLYAQATSGTPVLSDPLSDNSRGYNWDEGSHCFFGADGRYHAAAPHSTRAYHAECFAANTDFSNFAFQIQVTYISGFGGEIVFRAARGNGGSSNPSAMFFSVNPSGCVFGYAVPDNTTQLAEFPCTGLPKTNLVTVIARGDTYYLYVNKSFLGTVVDNTYQHGQIGVIGYYVSEVAFSNAEVWRL